MAIIFKNTAYFQSINSNSYKDSDKLLSILKNSPLKFKFFSVNLKNFSYNYTPNGRLKRKIIAIPALILSGVVKSTFHVFKGIFFSFFRYKYIKKQSFYLIRDFQESFGWFITLFNDKIGQFHLQESNFHKKSYELCTNRNLQYIFKSNSPSCFKDNFSSNDQPEHLSESDEIPKKIVKEFQDELNPPPQMDQTVIDKNINRSKDSKPTSNTETLSEPLHKKRSKIEKEMNDVVEKSDEDTGLIPNINTIKENIFKEYLEKNEIVNATNILLHISDAETRKKLSFYACDFYVNNGNLEEANVFLKHNILLPFNERDQCNVRILDAYLKKDDIKKAVEINENIIDSNLKRDCSIKIAESYLNKGDLVSAINIYPNDSSERDPIQVELSDSFYARIAEKQHDKDPIIYINKIFNKIIKRDSMIKLAEIYYKDGSFDKACKFFPYNFFEENSAQREINDCFYVKLAQEFLNRNENQKALDAIVKVQDELKSFAIKESLSKFYDQKDFAEALENCKNNPLNNAAKYVAHI